VGQALLKSSRIGRLVGDALFVRCKVERLTSFVAGKCNRKLGWDGMGPNRGNPPYGSDSNLKAQKQRRRPIPLIQCTGSKGVDEDCRG